jgi:hypothetical protein
MLLPQIVVQLGTPIAALAGLVPVVATIEAVAAITPIAQVASRFEVEIRCMSPPLSVNASDRTHEL